MKEIKEIIGENLTELRKKKGITQIALAEKLNYSDKAIYTWEKGASLPPIDVLVELANFYGVTLDYLVKDGDSHSKKMMENDAVKARRHVIITLLACVIDWIVATVLYACIEIPYHSLNGYAPKGVWCCFMWAVPITFILLLIFNAIWGKRQFMYPIIILLIWTLIASVYVEICIYTNQWGNMWFLFLIGVPLTIGTILFLKMKKY